MQADVEIVSRALTQPIGYNLIDGLKATQDLYISFYVTAWLKLKPEGQVVLQKMISKRVQELLGVVQSAAPLGTLAALGELEVVRVEVENPNG